MVPLPGSGPPRPPPGSHRLAQSPRHPEESVPAEPLEQGWGGPAATPHPRSMRACQWAAP